MKSLFPFLAIMFLLSSCARILNGKYAIVEINTKPSNALIIVNKKDTICCTDKPIVLRRTNESVSLKFQKDSLQKEILLKNKLSLAYLFGNIYTPYFLGYLIDLSSPKRFTYPPKIYVDMNDSINSYSYKTFLIDQHPTFNLGVSIPLANFYRFKTGDTYNDRGGMFGIAVNAEYYVSRSLYISSQASWLGHSSRAAYFHYNDTATSESRKIFYANLQINKRIERWHFGLGISYQQFYWKKFQYDSLGVSTIGRTDNKGFGLSVSAHYNFAKNFYVGMLYQPMIYNLNEKIFDYQHYLNIEFTYKLPLFQIKNKRINY